MNLLETWFHDANVSGRAALTAALVGAIVLVRWLVLRAVAARVEHGPAYFRTRKWLAYGATLIAVLGLSRIWLGGAGGITTYLGILSAGVAIALTDVLENLAGWVFIVTRRPFRVGDRIEIEGRSGDVVDVRAFRFSMLEIGNWVAADQSTGRLVHVPNGKVFSEQVSNYTEGFPYIWDEITVEVTFESDWRRAEQVVVAALDAHAPDTAEIGEAIRRAGNQYLIRYRHLTPTTYVSVAASGVDIHGRYLVGVRNRRSIKDALWRDVLDAFAGVDSLDLAYPTQRFVSLEDVVTRPRERESQE